MALQVFLSAPVLRRSRHILPGAGAGAELSFYSVLEPEPKCLLGAGAGAGADSDVHGSASLVPCDLTQVLAHLLLVPIIF